MAKDYIREGLNRLRDIYSYSLNEEEDMPDIDTNEVSDEAVPYTKNDDILNSSLQTCTELFGASFTKTKNPMLYYTKTKDVTLTGEIPDLENAKFEFKLLDSCYLWADKLELNEKHMKTLNVIWGAYQNWQNELNKMSDKVPMSIRGDSTGEVMNESVIQRGDDID